MADGVFPDSLVLTPGARDSEASRDQCLHPTRARVLGMSRRDRTRT